MTSALSCVPSSQLLRVRFQLSQYTLFVRAFSLRGVHALARACSLIAAGSLRGFAVVNERAVVRLRTAAIESANVTVPKMMQHSHELQSRYFSLLERSGNLSTQND